MVAVLAMLEIELDIGTIFDKDEIENEGDWGGAARGKAFMLSAS